MAVNPKTMTLMLTWPWSLGMFLFARLVMDHLYYQETEEDLLDQTRDSNFPVGLDEA